MDEKTQIRIAERAIRGERRALEQLWRLHRHWVAAVVLAHKPAEAELDDLLQEVALGLVDHVHELRNPARFKPWLRVLARNIAISKGRRASTRRRFLRPVGPSDSERADPRSVDEERMALREATRRTLEATAALSADQRECLLLRALRGMSQKDIAGLLGVPVTTVETRLARARRRLRQQLCRPSPRKAYARGGR